MTGRQEYDRNMTGRQDDTQDDRQRTLGEYMIDILEGQATTAIEEVAILLS